MTRLGRKTTARIFTLVELLVVVAIISLLMAILLPALGQVKGKARSMQCVSNLKNLYLAVAGYCDDYSTRRIPWAEYSSQCWVFPLLMATGYLKLNNTPTPEGILRCPEETRATCGTLTEWQVWRGPSHYGINWFMIYCPSWTAVHSLQWEPNQEIPAPPSKVMYFADAGPGWDATVYYGEDPRATTLPSSFRHEGNKRTNSLFLDGHVATGGVDSVPTEMVVGVNCLVKYYYFCGKSRAPTWLDM